MTARIERHDPTGVWEVVLADCVSHLVVAAICLLCGDLVGSMSVAVKLFATWYIGMMDLIAIWVGFDNFRAGRIYWHDNAVVGVVLTLVLYALWR